MGRKTYLVYHINSNYETKIEFAGNDEDEAYAIFREEHYATGDVYLEEWTFGTQRKIQSREIKEVLE